MKEDLNMENISSMLSCLTSKMFIGAAGIAGIPVAYFPWEGAAGSSNNNASVDGNDGRRRPGVQSRHHRAQSQPIISGTGPKNVVGGPLAEEDISGLKSSPSLSSSSSSKRNPTTVPARRHTSHLSLSSSVRRPRDQNQDAATPGPSSQSHRESKPATTTTIKENTQNETTDNNKISPGHLRHRSTGGKKKVEGSRETGR